MISKYYEQYNPNPLKKEVGDCVIRALCVVTNRSWYDIYDELSDLGRTKCAPFNTIMNELIEEHYGFKKHKVRREKGKKALNVETFCKEHPTGIYLPRLANHYIGIVNGKYYDLYPCWDKKTVYTYYEYTAKE